MGDICQNILNKLVCLGLETLHQAAPDASCGFCGGCITWHYPISLQ